MNECRQKQKQRERTKDRDDKKWNRKTEERKINKKL